MTVSTSTEEKPLVPPDEERWMTVAEVAAYVRLSRAKIYELAQQGQIPCVKVAGRWRFKREQIDEWMYSRPTPPATGGPSEEAENG